MAVVQTQMAQKPMLRAEVYAHAMRAVFVKSTWRGLLSVALASTVRLFAIRDVGFGIRVSNSSVMLKCDV